MANTKEFQFLTLAEIKEQARIEPDFTEEDQYLTLLGLAAERKLLKDIQRTVDEVKEMEGGEWPDDLTVAVVARYASSGESPMARRAEYRSSLQP